MVTRLLVAAILVSDDLLQRDGVISEEIETPTPAVLTVDQLRGETPLPDTPDFIVAPRWLIPVEPVGTVLEDHVVAVANGRIVALDSRAAAHEAWPEANWLERYGQV